MPFVYVADTAKIEVVGHNVTTLQPIVNVMHAKITDANQTQANIDAMAAALGSAVLADITQWSLAYRGDYVRVTGLKTATAPQSTDLSISGVAGTGASAPVNACALIKLTTAIRGRAYRGRVFISPLKTSYIQDSSSITTAAQATFDVFINDLQSALGGLTPASGLVIARRSGPGAGASELVTAWSTESEMASQRRRLVGR